MIRSTLSVTKHTPSARALVAAEQRSGGGADRGADDGALHRGVFRLFFGFLAADRVVGEAAAILVIYAEAVERFSGSGKHEDPGAGGRRSGARCEEQRAECSGFFHFVGRKSGGASAGGCPAGGGGGELRCVGGADGRVVACVESM